MHSRNDRGEALSHVLVVDDDAGILEVLTCLLEDEGYRVTSATDGGEALASCTQTPPDLVLLDIMLPFVDGVTVCRVLRADPCFEATPIIMMTALTDTQQIEEALDAGADDYVTKPYDTRDLIARMRAAHRVRSLVRSADRQREATAALTSELVGMERTIRTRVAAGLHDTVIQALVAARMWFDVAARDENIPPVMRWDMVELMEGIDEAVEVGRSLLQDLRPTDTRMDHLGEAVRDQVESVERTTSLKVQFVTEGDLEQLSKTVQTALYQIVREALLNVVQHADARHLWVRLSREDGAVVAVIEDDGKGFEPDDLDTGGHYGVSSFTERVEALGGESELQSKPGGGTKITVRLPAYEGAAS